MTCDVFALALGPQERGMAEGGRFVTVESLAEKVQQDSFSSESVESDEEVFRVPVLPRGPVSTEELITSFVAQGFVVKKGGRHPVVVESPDGRKLPIPVHGNGEISPFFLSKLRKEIRQNRSEAVDEGELTFDQITELKKRGKSLNPGREKVEAQRKREEDEKEIREVISVQARGKEEQVLKRKEDFLIRQEQERRQQALEEQAGVNLEIKKIYEEGLRLWNLKEFEQGLEKFEEYKTKVRVCLETDVFIRTISVLCYNHAGDFKFDNFDNIKERFQWFLKSKSFAELIIDKEKRKILIEKIKRSIAISNVSTGRFLLIKNETVNAIDFLKKGLKFLEKIEKDEIVKSYLFTAYASLAIAYKRLGLEESQSLNYPSERLLICLNYSLMAFQFYDSQVAEVQKQELLTMFFKDILPVAKRCLENFHGDISELEKLDRFLEIMENISFIPVVQKIPLIEGKFLSDFLKTYTINLGTEFMKKLIGCGILHSFILTSSTSCENFSIIKKAF